MNRASGFWAIRPLMSAICLDCWLLASVMVSCTPSLAASAFMLAVSASRHGLLLAFWLKATRYVGFFAILGAWSAVGTVAGAVALPGSAASTNGHGAADPPPAAAFPVSLLPPQAASRLAASTATPPSGAIFHRCTEPSFGSGPARDAGFSRC